jgi:hypothetical protein
MAPKGVAEAEMAAGAEVMASVEDGPSETFVIADISRDDANLTTPLEDAASLPAWR